MADPVPDPADPPPVDLVIIGAGPTGLFAAFYAGLRGLSVTLIDSLEVLGGQLTTLYPEKLIYDVAGFPQVLAKDLAARLVQQAMTYRPRVCLGQRVSQIVRLEDSNAYKIVTDKAVHIARAVVISAGVGAFEPKRLSAPEAKRYEGHGLNYFVTDLSAYQDKRVLIVGGGDSAVDWTNMIAPLASDLTVIHRRDKFRAGGKCRTDGTDQGACPDIFRVEGDRRGGARRVGHDL